jgi:X-Pro dipeptidyl-peptidase (S15 family)
VAKQGEITVNPDIVLESHLSELGFALAGNAMTSEAGVAVNVLTSAQIHGLVEALPDLPGSWAKLAGTDPGLLSQGNPRAHAALRAVHQPQDHREVHRTVGARALGADTARYRFDYLMLPMRDGIRLATILIRPQADGRYPTLLVRSPYPNGPLDSSGGLYKALFEKDYAVVLQNERGSE